MTVRIVGDVHGKLGEYSELVSQSDYSIQVGDMGFDYSPLSPLNSHKHTFLGGNHDNYDVYNDTPHSLGDFGERTLGPLDFFFIRGGYSLDWKHRVDSQYIGYAKSWWKEEQLNKKKRDQAIANYKKVKPEVMVTHSCPDEFAKVIGNPTVLSWFGIKDPDKFTTPTQQMLQSCFDAHRPKVWIFGHFHMNLDVQYKGTRFICLNELAHCDYDNGEFVHRGQYIYRKIESLKKKNKR